MDNYKIFQNVTYDSTTDNTYIKILDDKINDTKEIKQDILIDFNEEKKIVWIEILNTKKHKTLIQKILFSNTSIQKCVLA